MDRPNINLGDKARDTISGFEGVVVAKTEWLNGCLRITIAPQTLHEGKLLDSNTFDVEQVEVLSSAKPQASRPSGGPPIAPKRHANPVR